MAVGTGNLWRFPRIAAQNGGGAFLIPWLLFLFAWSIPLLIAEFGLGRGARRGPIGAFAKLTGGRTAWMGGFVAVTSVNDHVLLLGRHRVDAEVRHGGIERPARRRRRGGLLERVQHLGVAAGAVSRAGGGGRGLRRGPRRDGRHRAGEPDTHPPAVRAASVRGGAGGDAARRGRGTRLSVHAGSGRPRELSDVAGGLDAIGVVDRRRVGTHSLLCHLRPGERRRRHQRRDDRPGQQRGFAARGDGHPAGCLRHPARRRGGRGAGRRKHRSHLHLDPPGVRPHAGRRPVPAAVLPGDVLRRALRR